jgi:hypothetical protein
MTPADNQKGNDMTFKIEKGHPMPEFKRGAPRKYPWAQMEVGDSFFVPGNKTQSMSAVACSRAKIHPPERYICRKEVVDGVQGVRVRRVE